MDKGLSKPARKNKVDSRSTDPSVPINNHCYLLDLPPEIRIIICETFATALIQNPTDEGCRFLLAILFTNHELFQEASKCCYKRKEDILDPLEDTEEDARCEEKWAYMTWATVPVSGFTVMTGGLKRPDSPEALIMSELKIVLDEKREMYWACVRRHDRALRVFKCLGCWADKLDPENADEIVSDEGEDWDSN